MTSPHHSRSTHCVTTGRGNLCKNTRGYFIPSPSFSLGVWTATETRERRGRKKRRRRSLERYSESRRREKKTGDRSYMRAFFFFKKVTRGERNRKFWGRQTGAQRSQERSRSSQQLCRFLEDLRIAQLEEDLG